jgi:mannose-6-phosphate isomerase-like protein (cupin superfamily)
MFVRSSDRLPAFTAGDNCTLKEILNPAKDRALESVGYSLAHAVVEPGESTKPHVLTASEVYYVLKGKGLMHIGDETQVIQSGDAVYIPPQAVQFVECLAAEKLEFLCIVEPAWTESCERVIS